MKPESDSKTHTSRGTNLNYYETEEEENEEDEVDEEEETHKQIIKHVTTRYLELTATIELGLLILLLLLLPLFLLIRERKREKIGPEMIRQEIPTVRELEKSNIPRTICLWCTITSFFITEGRNQLKNCSGFSVQNET